MPWLTEDLAALGRMDGPPVGLVGLRSNYVAWGPQNVRWPGVTAMLHGREARNSLQYTIEQDIVGINFLYGVAFAATPAVLRAGGTDWLQLHWCSDTLLSFDLEQAGYQHYVSRAYVHHHGSRSGDVDVYPRLEQDARRWLEAYRPDFARRTWTG